MSSGLALFRLHKSAEAAIFDFKSRGTWGGVGNVTVKVDISFKILQQKRNIKANKQRRGNFRVGKGLYNPLALCGDLRNVEIFTIFTKTVMHHNFSWVLQSS